MIFFETKYFQRITVVQRGRRGLRIPNHRGTETGRGESGVEIDGRCHWDVNGYAQIMERVYIPKEQAHNSPCYVITRPFRSIQ